MVEEVPRVLNCILGDKIPDIHNLKAKRFILAHGFKGFGPWSAGSKEDLAW